MDTPEINRLMAAADLMNPVMHFLDWLREKNLYICELYEKDLMSSYYAPVGINLDRLVNDWMGIDTDLLEAEYRQMLSEYVNGVPE